MPASSSPTRWSASPSGPAAATSPCRVTSGVSPITSTAATSARRAALGRAELLAELLPSPGWRHSTLVRRTTLLALAGSRRAATASMNEALRSARAPSSSSGCSASSSATGSCSLELFGGPRSEGGGALPSVLGPRPRGAGSVPRGSQGPRRPRGRRRGAGRRDGAALRPRARAGAATRRSASTCSACSATRRPIRCHVDGRPCLRPPSCRTPACSTPAVASTPDCRSTTFSVASPPSPATSRPPSVTRRTPWRWPARCRRRRCSCTASIISATRSPCWATTLPTLAGPRPRPWPRPSASSGPVGVPAPTARDDGGRGGDDASRRHRLGGHVADRSGPARPTAPASDSSPGCCRHPVSR